jgi:hypothetical protein
MICWRLQKKRMRELFPWKGKEEVNNEALSWERTSALPFIRKREQVTFNKSNRR